MSDHASYASPSVLWALAGDTGAGTAWTLPSGQVNGKTVAAAAAGPIVDAAVELRLHNCTPNHHFEVRLKRRTSDELLWSMTEQVRFAEPKE